MTPDQIAYHLGNLSDLVTDKANAAARKGKVAADYYRRLQGAVLYEVNNVVLYERVSKARTNSFAESLRDAAATFLALATEVDKMNGN